MQHKSLESELKLLPPVLKMETFDIDEDEEPMEEVLLPLENGVVPMSMQELADRVVGRSYASGQ